MCVLLLLIGPTVMYLQNNQAKPAISAINMPLPENTTDWSGPVTSSNNWLPEYRGAISSKLDYQVRGDTVSLYLGYYPFQKQGEEVINDLNRISNNKIWRTQYPHAHIKQTHNQKVLEQVIENNQNNKRLVWYWYNIGGQVTVNKYEAKILQLTGLTSGNPQAYVVAVSVPIKGDIKLSRESLQEIVTDLKIPLANLQVVHEK